MSLDIVRIMESKTEKARILKRERNMKEQKGGETAELSPIYFHYLSRTERDST